VRVFMAGVFKHAAHQHSQKRPTQTGLSQKRHTKKETYKKGDLQKKRPTKHDKSVYLFPVPGVFAHTAHQPSPKRRTKNRTLAKETNKKKRHTKKKT